METEFDTGKQELNLLTLPIVIFDIICSYLSVNELEHMSTISEDWKSAVHYTIARRLAAVEKLPEAEREYHTKDLATIALDNLSLLKKYEANTVVGKVELKKAKTTHEIEFSISEDIAPVGVERPLNETFPFGCHELMCRWDYNLVHRNSLFKVTKSTSVGSNTIDYDAAGYTITSHNGQNNTMAYPVIVDVYRNKMLVGFNHHETFERGNTELWQIINVCHDTQTVTVSGLYEIFFPFPCLLLRIYCERVVAIFSTGYIGIWCPRSGDDAAEHLISKQRILGTVNDIFRIGNVMILHSERKYFHIIDALTEEQDFELTEIQFLDMCFTVFESRGFGAEFQFTSVDDVQLAGNVLLVKVNVLARKKVSMQAVCALKLRHFPTLQDFLTVYNFNKLVNMDESDIIAAPGESTMLLIPPSMVPGRLDQDNPRVKASFVTLPFSEQDKADVFDIVDSQGTSNTSPVQFDLKLLRSWITRSTLSKTST